jgi:hypothetical protein
LFILYIDALKNGQNIRLVGDNINWTIHVHDERIGRKGHMQHAFGSAVIIENFNFSNLLQTKPQKDYDEIYLENFLLSVDEKNILIRSFSLSIAPIIIRLIPYFNQFSACLPLFHEKNKDFMTKANTVIPLKVLMKNEQKYADVVQILDFYENFLEQCHEKAGISYEGARIHIGGDQMTRDRFSGAKNLRGHHKDDKYAFRHLSPITFELFHMVMNFMQVMFNELYSVHSTSEIGTLKFMQERLHRESVNCDVKKAYDADKEFLVAVTDVYVAAAVMHHFGLQEYTDAPTKNIPSSEDLGSINRMGQWFITEIESVIRNMNLFNVVLDDNEVMGKHFECNIKHLCKTL